MVRAMCLVLRAWRRVVCVRVNMRARPVNDRDYVESAVVAVVPARFRGCGDFPCH